MLAPLLLLAASLLPVPGRAEGPDEGLKYCNCAGVECQCCVDFNITYVDLGGPGCVKMKYLAEEESIMVNVSYGDSQLHQGFVRKGANESATCMDILLDLAQMCATFSGLTRTEGGLQACASLEPTLLGDPQDSYHLGCFHMSPERMQLLPSRAVPVAPTGSPESGQDTESGAEPISFLEAVNESAEDGIAWFTNFWGINFTKTGNSSQPAAPPAHSAKQL